MKKKTKKQVMAEGFDRWTSNGVGVKVVKSPKKAKKDDKKSK